MSGDADLARRLVACSEGTSVEVSQGGALLMGNLDGEVQLLLRGERGEDLLLLQMDPDRTRLVAQALNTLADRAENTPSGRLS